jgi:hypothetical protein
MSDDEFLEAFDAATIAEFHHADHIRAAWLYVNRYAPAADAVRRFTAALQHFAAAKGKPELYHETITWAYLFVINERRMRSPGVTTWVEFRERNPDLMGWKPGVLDGYYRPETLDSPIARFCFVMPDLGC